MNATISVICYKSKKLANNESPIMLCVCKDGKRKYKSLGLSINPNYWDFKKNIVKSTYPNYEKLNKVILDKKQQIYDTMLQYLSTQQEYTASSLIKSDTKNYITVNDFFKKYIERLNAQRRINYKLSVKQLYNSLNKFCGNLDFNFSEINISFLRNYETFLIKNGLSTNSIGIKFRTLRAIYNTAVSEHIVNEKDYPFKEFKISRLHQETAKRALKKDDINRIINYRTTNQYTNLAVKLFVFSYYCGGINFIDMANLTTSNLIDDKLIYTRHKTKKLIKIPLNKAATQIISEFHNPHSQYLFPILSAFHKSEIQKANRIHKVISNINKKLKMVGEELNLPLSLTTYIARHSQATIMKKNGVPISIIKEIMGHSSEKTTQIYLDSFDNDQIRNAMKTL